MSMKIDIENKEGRAKACTIEIGKKKLDFPRFSVNISHSNNRDVTLVENNLGDSFLNEYFIHMTPTKLKDILKSGRKHQREKDKTRNSLAVTSKNQMNLLYLSFKEFGGEKIAFDISPEGARSLLSLMDIENMDIVGIPMSPNFVGTDSMKNIVQAFKKQRADFLGEHALMGIIPYGLTTSLLKTLLSHYIKNDIESIGVDFGTVIPIEEHLTLILDILEKSGKNIHLHGFNVRPRSGHYSQSVQPIFDLLTRVYGFDSFGGIRYALGGVRWEGLNLARRQFKVGNVRLRVPKTYGDYDRNAILEYTEHEKWSCTCPSCKAEKIADMYDIQPNREDYDDLWWKARTHRIISTHQESAIQREKIKKGEFDQYLGSKSSVATEFQEMKKLAK